MSPKIRSKKTSVPELPRLPGPEGPERAKKYNSKVFFFFSYSAQNVVKLDVKLKKSVNLTKSVISFCFFHFGVKFDYVLIGV